MSVTILSGGLGHLLKASVSIGSLPYDQQFLASALALESDPEGVKVGARGAPPARAAAVPPPAPW
jgi:hypothetical protein